MSADGQTQQHKDFHYDIVIVGGGNHASVFDENRHGNF